VAELHGKSAELGAASSSGGRRRPWRALQVTGRKHGETEPGREKGKGGSSSWRRWGLQGVVSALTWQAGGGRRWPESLHAGALCLSEEDKGKICT
jgi:hypothetical protein